MRQALRAGRPFTAQLARYLKPEVTGNFDPNYAVYLSAAAVDLAALAKPGATEAAAECALRALEADEARLLPPPAEGGKPLAENPAPGPESPWKVAGSHLKIKARAVQKSLCARPPGPSLSLLREEQAQNE